MVDEWFHSSSRTISRRASAKRKHFRRFPRMLSVFVVLFLVTFSAAAAEVIQLDVKNFEHLTQASTGSTTGDWLIKFYAPWCGHCKKFEPAYDELSEMLKGEVNVARVDVTANRELGTRFDIKGFPTLKFLSKGKVYEYKGRRTAKDLAEFARGGYQIQEPEDIQPPLGMFGEIIMVFKHAYKQAGSDLKAGRFLTIDVFLTFMPVIFLAVVLLMCMLPVPEPPRPKQKPTVRESSHQTDAAPPTSESEATSKKVD